MTQAIPITEFAPAERVPIDIIRKQAEAVENMPLAERLLNSALSYTLIVNPQRQIVFSSRNCTELVPCRQVEQLLGKRPGEALGCARSLEAPEGCGTSAFCQECGALKVVLTTLAGKPAIEECRLTRKINGRQEALDLLVSGTPLDVGGDTCALLSIVDISGEKRRRQLERIFFHDLLNTAGGVSALAQSLQEVAPPDLREDAKLLSAGLTELVELVEAQKDLAAAENGDLALKPTSVSASALADEVAELYRRHPVAWERRIVRADADDVGVLITDPRLLRRVLGNLLKNALEASKPRAEVSLGCEGQVETVSFLIRNPEVMPEAVRLQVFQRSFSTKGSGRGLGTYSARLLTEDYLDGRVEFSSGPPLGTVFRVTLPRLGPAARVD